MSDDEDELHQLRAQRAARDGSSLAGKDTYFVNRKNDSKERVEQEEEEEEEEPASHARNDEDDSELMHGGLRSHFPMSFGLQEKKEASLVEMHETFKRSGVQVPIGPPRPPMPPSSSNRKPAEEEDGRREEGKEEEDLVGPSRPPPGGSDEEEDEEGEEEEEEGDDPWLLPITHEVSLGGHSRAVTALDIDHTGSRIVSLNVHQRSMISSV